MQNHQKVTRDIVSDSGKNHSRRRRGALALQFGRIRANLKFNRALILTFRRDLPVKTLLETRLLL